MALLRRHTGAELLRLDGIPPTRPRPAGSSCNNWPPRAWAGGRRRPDLDGRPIFQSTLIKPNLRCKWALPYAVIRKVCPEDRDMSLPSEPCAPRRGHQPSSCAAPVSAPSLNVCHVDCLVTATRNVAHEQYPDDDPGTPHVRLLLCAIYSLPMSASGLRYALARHLPVFSEYGSHTSARPKLVSLTCALTLMLCCTNIGSRISVHHVL